LSQDGPQDTCTNTKGFGAPGEFDACGSHHKYLQLSLGILMPAAVITAAYNLKFPAIVISVG